MHSQTDSEIRDLALTGNAAGQDLPFPAPRPEPAGNEHPVDPLEQPGRFFQRHPFCVDRTHPHLRSVVSTRMLERLMHREARVLQLHVLADERDLYDLLALRPALVEVEP